MPVDRDRLGFVFERLDRQLSKLASKPQPQNVHRFRTYTRRLEALLEELASGLGGNEKKLLKSLTWLRRRAGKVRDLDVQISALRSLKIPQEPERKAQLLRTLTDIRVERERKLHQALDRDTLRELRRRLKKAKRSSFDGEADPVGLGLRLFAQVTKPHVPLTEEILHKYRTAGKRIRYVVESAERAPEASQMLETLKIMQDALGDWHDWLMLTQTAESLFQDAQPSPLLTALRNVTGAKFRHALQVVAETRTKVLEKPSERVTQTGEAKTTGARRKPASRSAAGTQSAA
jgi:CHAD domain-containing protein